MRHDRRDPAPFPWARRLFVLAIVVVGVLSVWAHRATRQHTEVVESTLEEFAFLAARRYALALDEEARSLFHTLVFRARRLHRGEEVRGHMDDPPVPEGVVRAYVTVDPGSGEVRVHEGTLPDAAWEGWIARTVERHVEEVYRLKPQAPYAGLTRVGGGDFHELVYRMEEGDDGDREAFGALVDMTRLDPLYERAYRAAELLPPSAALRLDDPSRLVRVTLRAPDGGKVLWRSGPSFPDAVTGREVGAGRAGRIRVSVSLDPAFAHLLVPGGAPSWALPVAPVLGFLALALLGVAYVQARKERRLLRMREEFVANVSHELRTPLAQIRMFTESLLLERLPEEDDRRRALDVVHREAGRLSSMVENLLALSTPGDGADPAPRAADPVEVALETVESLEPLVRQRDATVVVGGGRGRRVAFDTRVFRRSLVNLLDNALKHGPPGQTVRVDVDVDGRGVTLSVADQGPGVPEEARDSIWERFSRGAPTGEGPAGTGLGLAVVREAVEELGGRVEVDHAEGRGARFRIHLPGIPGERGS